MPTEKPMLLTSAKTVEQLATFRMIPLNNTCPYNLCEFQPDKMILTLVLKDKVAVLKTVPKINDNGTYKKLAKFTEEGLGIAVRQEIMEENLEIHMSNVDEIDFFIKHMALNSDTFHYQQFLAKISLDKPKPKLLTLND